MSNRSGKRSEKRLRVRTKRLKEIDSTKLSLALWLIAKGIVEQADDNDLDVETAGDGGVDSSTEGA